MIKPFLFVLLGVMFLSCNKQAHQAVSTEEEKPLSISFQFESCEDYLLFMDQICTPVTDDKLKHGRFKIEGAISTYEVANSIFKPECFINLPISRAKEIFGEGVFDVDFRGVFLLDSDVGNRLGISVDVENNRIVRFNIRYASINDTIN